MALCFTCKPVLTAEWGCANFPEDTKGGGAVRQGVAIWIKLINIPTEILSGKRSETRS